MPNPTDHTLGKRQRHSWGPLVERNIKILFPPPQPWPSEKDCIIHQFGDDKRLILKNHVISEVPYRSCSYYPPDLPPSVGIPRASQGAVLKKLSIGLLCKTLSSLTQELNSHHKGIILWQVKKRWEADSTWLWQKGQRSFWRTICLLIRFSLEGSLSQSNLQAKDRAVGGILISHSCLKPLFCWWDSWSALMQL